MKNKKLSWNEIACSFDKEWVELIEYDWPETEIHPKSGVVRVHAKNRAEFDRLVSIDPPIESAFLFVGKPALPPDTVLNTFRVVELA